MRVVEVACETEERDYGGEFVQEEEGGDVGEWSVGERIGVFVEEAGEAAVEALDAGLGGWGRLGEVCCVAARGRVVVEVLCWTRCCAQEGPSQHFGVWNFPSLANWSSSRSERL